MGRRRKGKRRRVEVNVITSFGCVSLELQVIGPGQWKITLDSFRCAIPLPLTRTSQKIPTSQLERSQNYWAQAPHRAEIATRLRSERADSPHQTPESMEAAHTRSSLGLCDPWNYLSCFEAESFSLLPSFPQSSHRTDHQVIICLSSRYSCLLRWCLLQKSPKGENVQ